MSTTLPPAPPPPDYAKANQEGIYADIDTLPIRNQINQAAQLGQKITYTDPATGTQKVADFTGMGNQAAAEQAAKILADTNAAMQTQQLQLRQQLGVPNAEQTALEIKAADPLAYETRQNLTGQLNAALNGPKSAVVPNAGLADAAAKLGSLADNAPSAAGTNDTLRNVMASVNDPEAKARLGALYNEASDPASKAQLASIYDTATRLPENFTDTNAAALNPALRGALDDYALGGTLNQNELRDVTNNTRAGQVARGNYLGDAAAVQEAMNQGTASDARKQQRLQNLLNIQNQVFGQGDTLRNESQNAALSRLGALTGIQGQGFGQDQQSIATRAGLQGQDFTQGQQRDAQLAALAQQIFGNNQSAYTTQLNATGAGLNAANLTAQDQRATRAENYGQDQQNLANASAMVLGQPITNQFGSLTAAQNGAVGYTPVNYNGVGQLNQNAGQSAANFSQQNFGTLANMWNTTANIAQQDNAGKMSMISGIGGAAMGAMI